MATYTGTTTAETLTGGSGNDLINAGAGNDTVYGGAGDDTIYGGSDATAPLAPNYVSVNGASATVTGTGGRANFTATSSSGDGELTAYNFYGVNGVWIGNGDSTETHTHVMSSQVAGAQVYFNAVNTSDQVTIKLDGQTINLNTAIANGTITFNGAGGYTTNSTGQIVGISGGNVLATGSFTINVPFTTFAITNTGAGNGTVYDLRVNTNPVNGGSTIVAGGNDVLYGGDGNDLISTDTGDDTVDGGTGNDTVLGGTGRDSLSGGAGDDSLSGDSGNDNLFGGDGQDRIYGGEGDDALSGGAGADLLDGGAGNDTILFQDGADTVYGGDGNDLIDDVDGWIEAGDTRIDAGAGCDLVWAGGGADTVLGGDDDDTLIGEDGNDLLEGGAGADALYGDGGDDTLAGGLGQDSLKGGEGRDLFQLLAAESGDQIADFDLRLESGSTIDRLDVSDLQDGKGGPVKVWHVRIAEDDAGNTVLSFPEGESVTLQGVLAKEVSEPGMLAAMGVPCFAAGTRIATPDGPRPVERLHPGDLVRLAGGGTAPVLWCGARWLSATQLQNAPALRPIRLAAAGWGLARDLVLSPQHCVALPGPAGPVLVRARHLAAYDPFARVVKGARGVSYHHILLPCHDLVLAEGLAVESLYPGPLALASLPPADFVRLLACLRDLGGYGARCLPVAARAQAARAVARRLTGNHPAPHQPALSAAR